MSRGFAVVREPVATCLDVDGRRLSANFDEEPEQNEGHRADAQSNTTQSLNRVDCVGQAHGKSPISPWGPRNASPRASTYDLTARIYGRR